MTDSDQAKKSGQLASRSESEVCIFIGGSKTVGAAYCVLYLAMSAVYAHVSRVKPVYQHK